jgi:uncharacterized protein YndB with AHSA1/START domain
MATTSITPTTHIESGNDVVTAEVFIAAPRERVFEAITDPDQAVRWWGQAGKYVFSEFQMDVRVGGRWSCAGKSVNMGGDVSVHGEFREVDPPRRLAYSWISNWMPGSTEVVWELESQSNGTLLKLTHTGFAGNADHAKGHSIGWGMVLGWLQSFVEKGETVASRG